MRTRTRRQSKALTAGDALSLKERSSGRNAMTAAAGCVGSRRGQRARPALSCGAAVRSGRQASALIRPAAAGAGVGIFRRK